MKELKQIIQAFELACEKRQKAALATVVHVAGSSYRGAGARMLITEDGMFTGAISGGCLEGDALRKALMAIMQGKPLLATYDTSDEKEAVIGAALGCQGIIRVLIEPIMPEKETNPVALLKSVLSGRQAVVLVTFFSLHNKWSLQQGTSLLIRESGEMQKRKPVPGDLLPVINDAKRVFERKESLFIHYSSTGDSRENEELSAFIEYIAPNISLVVAGAGNDVIPLVQISEVLGWDITLVDGRPNYASKQRFPDCRLIVSDPGNALRNVVTDDRTAAVLMTHNYNYDKSMLRALLNLPVNYIGMLGPRKKLEKMLSELEEEGTPLTGDQLSRIYSPVGLTIGAETAEEIALAILAEIKAVFAGKTGGHLRSLPGSIHHRKAKIMNGEA